MAFLSRKRWLHALERRREFCLVLLLILTSVGLVGYSAAAAQDTFRVTKEMQITADIADLPLGQALEGLSQNIPLEIRGSVAADERLTLHFSQLTPEQALQRMMAGYNYVLIRPDVQGRLVLVILGKAEKRTISAPMSGVGGTMHSPAEPASAGQPLVTGPVPAPTGAPSPLPMTPSAQSATLPRAPSEAPPPLAGPAPPAYDGTTTSSSSATAMPLPPVPPPPTTPVPAGPAGAVQTATTGQGNPPPDSNLQGAAGVTPIPGSEIPYNPAAWGGRGFKGGAASGKK